jgi:hypothetical protein
VKETKAVAGRLDKQNSKEEGERCLNDGGSAARGGREVECGSSARECRRSLAPIDIDLRTALGTTNNGGLAHWTRTEQLAEGSGGGKLTRAAAGGVARTRSGYAFASTPIPSH